MKKTFKNNKGFSLTELLAVITIMGIFSSLAIGGMYVYKKKATDQAYETLYKSIASATENYLFEHPETNSITISTLLMENFLDSANNPKEKGEKCSGTVNIIQNNGTDNVLSKREYEIRLTCNSYNGCKKYPEGTNC